MENALEIFDKGYLDGCLSEYNLCVYERVTIAEMILAVKDGDEVKLGWFGQFESELRHILLNSYGYRKGLEFGFREISVDEYGWLKRPVFLDQQETEFGRND